MLNSSAPNLDCAVVTLLYKLLGSSNSDDNIARHTLLSLATQIWCQTFITILNYILNIYLWNYNYIFVTYFRTKISLVVHILHYKRE